MVKVKLGPAMLSGFLPDLYEDKGEPILSLSEVGARLADCLVSVRKAP